MKKFLFFIFLITIQFLEAQTIVELTPSRDASLGYHDTYNAEFNNYNNAQQCAAFCIPGTNGGVNSNRALLQFALAQIPQQATILSAKLTLYKIPQMGFLTAHTLGNSSSTLKRVISSWQDNLVSWNTQPTTTDIDEVVLPAATQPNQDYIDIDVLSLVTYSVANPATNFGYLLSLVNESPNRVLMFCSTSYPNSNKWPKLVIEYCENGNNEGIDTLPVLQNATIAYQDNFEFATTNYNESIMFSAQSAPGSLGGSKKFRSLISFDLSSTNSLQVSSATLSLFAITLHGTLNGHLVPNNASLLKRVIEPWDENNVNWNNQPNVTTQNEVLIESTSNVSEDYTNIDVTEIINDIISSNENYGILLGLENEANSGGLIFGSESYPIASKRPRLTVSYCGANGGKINGEMKSYSNEFDFSLSPNPNNTGLFNLNFEEGIIDGLIDFFDISGKRIKSCTVNGKKDLSIDLNDLENGVYFSILHNKGKVYTHKIILNKYR